MSDKYQYKEIVKDFLTGVLVGGIIPKFTVFSVINQVGIYWFSMLDRKSKK